MDSFWILSVAPILFSFLAAGLAGCGGGSTTTTGCTGCSTKPTQHIAVADDANNRVMIFDDRSVPERMRASCWRGGLYSAGHLLTGPSGMNDEIGIASDLSGNLYIADLVNNRVLQFVPPFSNGMNASIVFGQSNLTTYTPSSSASGLGTSPLMWQPMPAAISGCRTEEMRPCAKVCASVFFRNGGLVSDWTGATGNYTRMQSWVVGVNGFIGNPIER